MLASVLKGMIVHTEVNILFSDTEFAEVFETDLHFVVAPKLTKTKARARFDQIGPLVDSTQRQRFFFIGTSGEAPFPDNAPIRILASEASPIRKEARAARAKALEKFYRVYFRQ